MASFGISDMTTVVTPTTRGGSGLSVLEGTGIAIAALLVLVILILLILAYRCYSKPRGQPQARQPVEFGQTAQVPTPPPAESVPLLQTQTVQIETPPPEESAPLFPRQTAQVLTPPPAESVPLLPSQAAQVPTPPPAESVPLLPSQAETQQFGEKYVLELSQQMGQKWRDLAIRLGFTSEQVEGFEAANTNNLPEQCRTMLVTWYRQYDDREGVPCKLSQALKEAGRADLALTVPEDTRPVTAEDLNYCQEQVLEFYRKTTSKIQAHPLRSYRTVGIDEFFFHLELSQELHGKTKSHEHMLSGKQVRLDREQTKPLDSWEDMFKPHVVGESMILLSGRAGCGKSTLLLKIANTCTVPGSKSPVAKFKLVFLLKLKLMRKSSCVIDAIFEQILPKDTELTKPVLKRLIADNKAKVAFLLDGLDEIPSNILKLKKEVYNLKDILQYNVLRGSCVLVATRPHMVDDVLRDHSHYARIHLTGFTSETRDDYITSKFTDDPDSGYKMISRVASTPFLSTLAEIPLLTLMLCVVWQNQASLPDRLTALYRDFVETLFKRLSDKSVNEQQMKSNLKRLGYVALNGILNPNGETLAFSSEEFDECPVVLEDGRRFGFLQQESLTIGLREVDVVTFLHSSFQEYYAAYYLAHLRDDEIRCHLKQIRLDSVSGKENLLQFCCGMSSQAAGLMLEHIKDLAVKREDRKELQRLARLLLFESDSRELVSELDQPTEATCISHEDLMSLHFYLQHVPRPLVGVRLDIRCDSYEELELLRAVLLSDNLRSTQLQKVTYTMSAQGTKEMRHLEATVGLAEKRLRARLPQLEVYIKEKSSFDKGYVVGCISRISDQVERCTLVLVSRFPSNVIGILSALKECPLYALCVYFSDMHGKVNDLAPYITTSMKEVQIFACRLNDDDVPDLVSVLHPRRGLKALHLDYNEFSLNGVSALTDHLRSFPELASVSLKSFDLDDYAVKQHVWRILPVIRCNSYEDLMLLRQVLVSDNTGPTRVEQVSYTMSRQGKEEIQHLKDTLSSTDKILRSQLQLRLEINEWSSFNAECVVGGISDISTQVLNFTVVMNNRSHHEVSDTVNALKDCHLCGFDVCNINMHGHMAALVPVVTLSLEDLRLNTCGLVDDDISDLLSILPADHCLKELSLDGNKFSLDAVKANADRLRDFPMLINLSLDNMGFDEDLVKQTVWQIIPVIQCRSCEDLVLLKDVVMSPSFSSTQLVRKVWHTMSRQGKRELEILEETLGSTDARLCGQLEIRLDIDQSSYFDVDSLLSFIFRTSNQVKSFTFVMIARSYRDVSNIVNALQGCHLYGFGVFHTNMRGRLTTLGALFTLSLKDLGLGICGLTDNDITDLISMLPACRGLEGFNAFGNAFSLDAVKALCDHLCRFPQLTRLTLQTAGLSEDLVKQSVWQVLPCVQCSSDEDLVLLRDVLQSGNVGSTRLTGIVYTVSARGKDQMQHLEDTLDLTDERLRHRLHLKLQINEKSYFDVDYLSECISHISNQVGRVTLVMRRRSHHDIVGIMNALDGCQLYGFGVRYVDMHGHVTTLAPFVSSFLKRFEVVACHLTEDDVGDLISILPAGHGLEELDAEGNDFSLDAVKTLRDHFQGLPKLSKVLLDNAGLGEDLIERCDW